MKIAPPASTLPYAAPDVFALAADIERYPEFLAGWRHARILARDGNRWRVSQALGLGPLQLEFESLALVEPPRCIEVSAESPPFSAFSFRWLIEPLDAGCSRVSVAAQIVMRSRLSQHAVDILLPTAMTDVMRSFEARARRLYGSPLRR